MSWLRAVLGAALLLLPGAVWTWAVLPRLDWAKSIVLTVLLSLTLVPATHLALAVLFGLGYTAGAAAGVALGLAAAGAAVGLALRPRTEWPRLRP